MLRPTAGSSLSRKRRSKFAQSASLAAGISFVAILVAVAFALSYAVPLRWFPPNPDAELVQIAHHQVVLVAIPTAAAALFSLIALIALLRNGRVGIVPIPILAASLLIAAALLCYPRDFTTADVDPNDIRINMDLSNFRSFGSQFGLLVQTTHKVPPLLVDLLEQPRGIEMLGDLNRGDHPPLDLSPEHMAKLHNDRTALDAEINAHSSFIYLGSLYAGDHPALKWGDHILFMYSKPHPALAGRLVFFADNWLGWLSESDFQKAFADFQSRTTTQKAPPTTTPISSVK